jgi:hypothetical protein
MKARPYLRWPAILATVFIAATASAADVFPSPEAAKSALLQALAGRDKDSLLGILGSGAASLVNSGDPTYDDFILGRLSKEASQQCDVNQWDENTVFFNFGGNSWQLPIPLKKNSDGWRFDVSYGKGQILQNRIRRNEAGVRVVRRQYVNAQLTYAQQDRTGNGVLKFAQRFISSPGTHDGLYWPRANDAENASPLADLIQKARQEGYGTGEFGVEPYQGYCYRILTSQGANAQGGARDYIIGGNMTGGFALLAWPAKWGDSGKNTFLVNQQGQIWQKDFGAETATAAKKITSYDPDASWQVFVEE